MDDISEAKKKLVDRQSFIGLFIQSEIVMGALISKPYITINTKIIKVSVICLKQDCGKIQEYLPKFEEVCQDEYF